MISSGRAEYAGFRTQELRVAGASPTLIMLHGFAHPAGCWSGILAGCERAGHAAVAVDLPGFGAADPVRPGPRLPQLVRFVGALVAAHGSDTPVVLVGNSLGAASAVCLLDECRDLPVSGLLALNTASGQWTRLARLALRSRLDLRVLPPPRWGAPAIDRVAARLLYGDARLADPEMVSLLTAQLRSRRARRELSGLLGLAVEVAAVTDVRNIACPSVFVHGSRDRIVPVESSMRLHAATPGSRLVVLDGVGHCPHLDATDRITELALQLAGNHTEIA